MSKSKVKQLDVGEKFDFEAALYFLDDEGHYLFKYKNNGVYSSKYIRHQDVRAAFTQVEADSDWIDPGIKRFGANKKGDWFIFFVSAHKREILFAMPDGQRILSVPVPSTLLFGIQGECSIYAMKSKEFNVNAPLFLPPFPNTTPRICWGDVQLPETHHKNARKIWELFFGSVFNAHLSEGKINGHENESCLRFWQELSDREAKAFPNKWLIQARTSIQGLVKD